MERGIQEMRAIYVLLAVLLLAGCEPSAKPMAKEDMPYAKMTREEFEAKVTGSTDAGLLAMIGTPQNTSKSGDTELWYYRKVTKDARTDKIDDQVQVVLEKQRVVRVNFN